MNLCTIAFYRIDEGQLDYLNVLQFTTEAEDRQDLLKRFERALNAWMTQTPEGKSAWQDSHSDFNIGDFLTLCGSDRLSLQPFLAAQGILGMTEVYALAGGEVEHHDTVLANPEFLT